VPQHIGIDACSAEGAALGYRTISWMAPICWRPHNHAEISMHAHPFAEYVKCICANHWAGVAELMLSSSQKRAQTGADFLIAPANTIYQAFDVVEHRSPRPWLHIAVALANEAKRCPYKRLGVLGTSQRMEGPVYRDPLKSAGIDHRVPRSRTAPTAQPDHLRRADQGRIPAPQAGLLHRGDAEPERSRLRRPNPGLHGSPAAPITGGGSTPDARFDMHLSPSRVAQGCRRLNV